MPRYLVKQLGLQESIKKIPYHIQLLIASEITMSIYAFKQIGAKLKLPFISPESSQIMEGALLWAFYDLYVGPKGVQDGKY